MNVLFDNIIFNLQSTGGISVVWYQLLRRAMRDESFNKRFISYDNSNDYYHQLTLPYHLTLRQRFRPYGERFLQPHIDLPFEHCVFHSSYFRYLNDPSVVNITTIHDFIFEFYRENLARYYGHKQMMLRAIRHSEGIICVSEHTKRDLMTFYPKMKEDRVKVVYNGVDKRYRMTERREPCTPFEQGSYLLFVGSRVAKYKNFEEVVELASRTGMPLVFVGVQPTPAEQMLLSRKVGKRYHCCTGPTIEHLNELYNQAFCLVYPSDYEGFGIPIIEAQQAGCPVLTKSVASIPEVAGDAALLIKHHERQRDLDAMEHLIYELKQGRIDRSNLIERGMQNARRFSWDKTYAETVEFYRQIDQATH